MNIHDQIEEWMAAAVTGALTLEEQQCFERHLAECPSCRALFAEEQKMNTMLQNTLGKLRPDAQFEQRMVRAFRTTEAGEGWRSRLRQGFMRMLQWRALQMAVTVAVLFALVKGGALLTGEKSYDFSGSEASLGTGGSPGQSQQQAMREISPTFGLQGGGGGGGGVAGTLTLNGVNTDGEITTPSGGSVPTDEQRVAVAAAAAPEGAADISISGAGSISQENDLASNNAVTVASGMNVSAEMDYQSQYISQGKKEEADGAATTAEPATPGNVPASPGDMRKLIRDANLELEVVSFDKAVETIATLAAGEQGYVDTQKSERGANGKLQGQIVVKVPPEKLDELLAEVRGLGDVKNQSIGTQDVTKDYYDTAARLHNAQTMEDRLNDLMKTQTGKLSELLQVERELERVRGEIEQMQGQLKLYDALVQFATVTVNLREKDLNQPAAYVQREHATLALFAPDVEAAFAQAKAIAGDVQAQIAQSQMVSDDRGRREATLSFLVAPEKADAAITRLKALGRVENFNDQTERVARDGSGNTDAAKIERGPVQVDVSIVPDEERTVQQTSLSVQTDEVEAKATQIKEEAAAVGATVTNAGFERAADGSESATLTLRLPLRSYPALLEQIKALGEVKDFTVSRQDSAVNGENAPVEIALQIFHPADLVAPDNGVGATIRRTLAQGAGALLWSVRMIGVSLAFVTPWALALGLVGWVIFRRRR
jgi:hypothetical protein